jgi:hypothetical protein
MNDQRWKPTSALGGERLGQALRALPPRVPPPGLTTSLRVLASRERQRRLEGLGWLKRYSAWRDRFRLTVNNLMRPLALPLTGGVFSAVVLFSMWVVPTYPLLRVAGNVDVPTVFVTKVTVKGAAPLTMPAGDMVVDVTVDDQGRTVDYNVVSGSSILQDDSLRRRLENVLLFTEFVPATTFGRPTAGKIRLWLGSSRIDVKG